MFRSKDIMTKKPVTVRGTQLMTVAYALMHERNIRHLPVVNDSGEVIGILSDRDVQRAMTVKRQNQFQQSLTLDTDLVVEDFMSWPVYVVSEDTSVRTVAKEMLAQKVSAFLIQDTNGEMKGIVTTDDLLKLFLLDAPILAETSLRSLTKHFFTPVTV